MTTKLLVPCASVEAIPQVIMFLTAKLLEAISADMASVDPIEKNTEFAKAKSVTLGQGANAQVVEKKEADFPLLSDPSKETAKAYGVLNDRGVANRWTFYIDKTGKISYIEKMVKPETSAEDMAHQSRPQTS